MLQRQRYGPLGMNVHRVRTCHKVTGITSSHDLHHCCTISSSVQFTTAVNELRKAMGDTAAMHFAKEEEIRIEAKSR